MVAWNHVLCVHVFGWKPCLYFFCREGGVSGRVYALAGLCLCVAVTGGGFLRPCLKFCYVNGCGFTVYLRRDNQEWKQMFEQRYPTFFRFSSKRIYLLDADGTRRTHTTHVNPPTSDGRSVPSLAHVAFILPRYRTVGSRWRLVQVGIHAEQKAIEGRRESAHSQAA